jgi:hypothetical protein
MHGYSFMQTLTVTEQAQSSAMLFQMVTIVRLMRIVTGETLTCCDRGMNMLFGIIAFVTEQTQLRSGRLQQSGVA